VNQDGRSAGLTAPNGQAQEAVIRAALANAGLAPDNIDAIEAHGTGTSLGDPIEMHSLVSVFAGRTRPLAVGSVKSNIGHTEAAAGIAGLIKAVLMLRHQAVPASLHFRKLNPHIDLGGVPIEVPAATGSADLARIGVSSFGFSGTNAHVIVERAPDAAAPPPPVVPPQLLISARTPEALRTLIERYRVLLDNGASFADLCHSAAVGRARLPWWICVDSPDQLAGAQPSDAPLPELQEMAGRRVDLPLYPFQRQHYWVRPAAARATRPSGAHPLLGRRLRSATAEIIYENVLTPLTPAWLDDHTVNDKAVMPAAGLVEMLLAAMPDSQQNELSDIAFVQLLVPDERPVVQTVVDPVARKLRIVAAEDSDDAPFTTIAEAAWKPIGPAPAVPRDARATATTVVDLPKLYARFADAGLVYGPAFRGLRFLAGKDGIAVADLPPSDSGWRLDPRVLDAAWQSLAAALPETARDGLVPAGLDRLLWLGGTPASSVLHLRTNDRADVALLDVDGRLVAWCEGLRLAPIQAASAAVLSQTIWQEIAGGDAMLRWIDCRNEADPVAACWRIVEDFRQAGDLPSRLAVLAHRATPAHGTVPLPAQAALVGLVASLTRERPELRPILIDLDTATGAPPAVPHTGDTTTLAYRDRRLWAPRLTPRAAATANPVAPFALARGEAATLDTIRWAPSARRSPGPGEIEVEIATTGINFRDVMNLLGVYPGDGGAPGVECAGTVATVGPGVTEFSPGDVVVAIAAGSFASHVTLDARLACRVPLALDWRVVAAQPVAMLTARLALDDVAHLGAGQRVLIHAATGGVGLAALALARARGATIVATAGSPAKRAHLQALGVTEIYDSRTLDFSRAAPVDVVINSLTGAAIPAGLRLLKPNGIFLELGKAELWGPDQVAAVRPDVRYEPIALDRLILEEPARVGEMLRAAVAALAAGHPPLPVTPYAFADVTDALRVLQSARHMGKLALNRTLLRGDATYVVSGGTGAIGREIVGWLAAHGARDIVVLSRHGAEVDVPGVAVRSLAVDMDDPQAVRAALAGLSPSLKGIFHLAAELHDATAATMTREQLAAAFGAKLRGAQALDDATRDLALDHFVLFGSLAGQAGSAGQANYAAANAALDAVVQDRRARGLPATLIDWGAWRGLGMARALDGPALDAGTALAALDVAMAGNLDRVAISAGGRRPPVAAAAFAQRIAAAVGSAKRDVLEAVVDEIVGRILGLGDLALERTRPLPEMGLDSLMAVELRNALGGAIGRVLPTSLVFDHPTAQALCDYLTVELGLVSRSAPRSNETPGHAAPVPIAAVAVETDELDEEAALQLLERKLSHAGH
ncbi:MAG: KR domain-containing protein, partial [Proteobacteria bacterium]|nr:KR domain-containing protein [Pseudomonadota bacterium]